MGKRLLLTIACIAILTGLKAQNKNIDNTIEKLVENAPDIQKQSLIIELYDLAEHPININTKDIDKLTNIYILDPSLVDNIKYYRKKNGNFYSIYELKLVKGFSPDILKKIAPFITASQPHQETFSHLNYKTTNDIIIKSQRTFKTPKEPNKYLGNNWKHSLRYKLRVDSQIEVGIQAEKDAGEEFFTGNQKQGFDFYSGYMQLNTKGRLQHINLGDFKTNWGQGLVSWNGFTMGKSAYTIIRGNSSTSIKKYSSTDENNFFRGIALTYKLTNNLKITPFLSYKKRDAKLIKQPKNENEEELIEQLIKPKEAIILSDLTNTGYHRTQKEYDKKHKAKENVYGCRICLNSKSFLFGINYLKSKITPPIAKSTGYWQTYYFSGKENRNISIDYKFTLKRIYFFGESAISQNNSQAHICGANLKPTNSSELSVIYRHYSKDYQSLYSCSFGEYSDTKNEQGLYIGMEIFPLKKIKINAYFDYYKFPYKRYCINTPGNGIEYLGNVEYVISDKINMYVKYKYEKKPRNLKIEKTTITTDKLRQYLRYHINLIPSEQWEFRSRIELSQYTHQIIKDKGYVLFQDILFTNQKSTIRTQLRYTYFNTDSYNSRIYTYENDLLYSFYSPALFYKGYRTYLNTRFILSKNITIYCKYALTRYLSNKTSASNKKSKSEFKIQLRLKL